MKKMKDLILTGWSKNEYLAAAAAALAHLNFDADVAGVSMDALAAALAERGPGHGTVYVLGVGLCKNLADILSALGALRAKGVRTVWLSALPVAPEFASEVCLAGGNPAERGFDVLEDAPRDSLVDAVADHFGIAAEDAAFFRGFVAPVEDRASATYRYQLLVRAAGFLHRTRRDDGTYAAGIRMLAERRNPDSWPAKLLEDCQDYVRFGQYELSGTSEAVRKIKRIIVKAGKYDRARVIILGPSGSGKEMVARQIHANSPRKNHDFVAFNCASVTPGLMEDRFFGHEKGAFTGADRQTKGLFELANGSVLFLDEIGEMPLEVQAMLLRALQENEIIRVGGVKAVPVDVRLVVATNRSLPQMVREGRFRADLYQRLSTIVIEMPPLAGRDEDIRVLADGWWMDMGCGRLTKAQLDALCAYDYPGNVRELFNLLDRAVALEERDFTRLIADHRALNRDLRADAPESEDREAAPAKGAAAPGAPSAATALPDNLDAAIRVHARAVFDKYRHNLTATRKALGISPNTLKKYLASGAE